MGVIGLQPDCKVTQLILWIVERIELSVDFLKIFSMEYESSSSDTSDGNDGVRGRAKCKRLKKMKKGEKINVEHNERGQPIGIGRKDLQSYIGILAKSRVPITLDAWSEFDGKYKLFLWNAVKEKFNLDDNEMKNVLSSMGESWKKFKSTLTTKYITPFKDQPDIITRVPKVYKKWIEQADWDQFVATRLGEKFQKVSMLNSKRRAQKKYNHRVSKKGYAGLEEELKTELGSAFDPTDRALKWKRAHQDKNHCYVDDATREVGERIDTYTKKVAEGEVVVEGSNDVLTMSLGTPEHDGRVRAVGKGITPTTYFHLTRRGSKRHTRELEILLEKEREKRKEEEAKRRDFQHELLLLMEKVKQLEEGRSASPYEKMASNSNKSDNRDYLFPNDEEHQSPKKRKHENQRKGNKIHRSPLKTKSKFQELINRKGKSVSSNLPAPSKTKGTPEKDMKQKSKTGTTFLGTIPNLGKAKKCKLAVSKRTNIVARGTIYEGNGPEQLLHGKILGENNVRVSVDEVLSKKVVSLPIPVGDELLTVNDAKGSHVAWPKNLVIREEMENNKEPNANNGHHDKPNSNSGERIKCDLAARMRCEIDAKGTLYKEFGPEYEFEGSPLGNYNVLVSVDEILEGHGDMLLPISIADEVVIISDAIGRRVAWPKRLVVHSEDEITLRENRWKETKELEMAKKRRRDALKSEINEFKNGVHSIMTKDSHLILIVEEGMFEKELGPIHLMKEAVIDICDGRQVDVLCVTAYMSFLYEKLKKSQTSYGLANPAIFDYYGQNTTQSHDLRDRLGVANIRNQQYIFLPYNPGGHWVLIIIDLLSMKVYWLDSLRNKPDFKIMHAVNSAIIAVTYGNGSKKRGKVSWECVKCPQQPGYTECAYYVMHFMRHFVNDLVQPLEAKILELGNIKTYSEGDLVEVRHEWIKFVQELSPLD